MCESFELFENRNGPRLLLNASAHVNTLERGPTTAPVIDRKNVSKTNDQKHTRTSLTLYYWFVCRARPLSP